MKGFIFRVCAYHGEPVAMNGNGVHARSGLSVDTPVPDGQVINNPNDPVIKDLADGGKETDYDIGALIEDFQDEYDCKINYDFDLEVPPAGDSIQVYQFDVFEPSWPDVDEAVDAVYNLSERLIEWAEGYPRGR